MLCTLYHSLHEKSIIRSIFPKRKEDAPPDTAVILFSSQYFPDTLNGKTEFTRQLFDTGGFCIPAADHFIPLFVFAARSTSGSPCRAVFFPFRDVDIFALHVLPYLSKQRFGQNFPCVFVCQYNLPHSRPTAAHHNGCAAAGCLFCGAVREKLPSAPRHLGFAFCVDTDHENTLLLSSSQFSGPAVLLLYLCGKIMSRERIYSKNSRPLPASLIYAQHVHNNHMLIL